MQNVSIKKEIPVSAIKVWHLISALEGLDRYLEIFTSCEVVGNGVGAVRNCELFDGRKYSDKVIELNESTFTFKTELVSSDLPFKKYYPKIELKPLDESKCELTWSADFEVESSNNEMKELLKSTFNSGIEGIIEFFKEK